MRVLVACEFSGIERDAFAKRGHDAWSCDLLPSERPGQHIQGDVLEHLDDGWDLMIAHPPCQHLAVSGAPWFASKPPMLQQEAIRFFLALAGCFHIPKVCIENPVCIMSTMYRKPDQIIQPYQFGHPEQKKTCLWLEGLPVLKETRNVYDEMMQLPKRLRERNHYESPGPNRWKKRSIAYQGIADAMAEQRGC